MDSYCAKGCASHMTDPGAVPFTINMGQMSWQNQNFRTALWTGNHLQLTVMCIPFRGEIGLELHPDTDQLIRVEEGQATVRMGKNRDQMTFRQCLGVGGRSADSLRNLAQYCEHRKSDAEALLRLCPAPASKGDGPSDEGRRATG